MRESAIEALQHMSETAYNQTLIKIMYYGFKANDTITNYTAKMTELYTDLAICSAQA